MSNEDIITSLLGWMVIFGILYFYTQKNKAEHLSPFKAFGMFISYLLGIILLSLIIVVGIIYLLGKQDNDLAMTIGTFILIPVAIQAWHYSISKIKMPNKSLKQDK